MVKRLSDEEARRIMERKPREGDIKISGPSGPDEQKRDPKYKPRTFKPFDDDFDISMLDNFSQIGFKPGTTKEEIQAFMNYMNECEPTAGNESELMLSIVEEMYYCHLRLGDHSPVGGYFVEPYPIPIDK